MSGIRSLAFLFAGLTLLLVHLGAERARLGRARRRLSRLIAVTGTRGKSSVTRLIAAGLREAGLRVMAKTTGSKAVLIDAAGEETELCRAGPPSIREQARLVRRAAESGAEALVVEMMSIGRETLAVESGRILRPDTLVLTNVRVDHIEALGRKKEDIAEAYAASFPHRADIFFPEEEGYPVFAQAAERTGSRLHPVGPPASPAEGKKGLPFSWGDLEPPIRLASAVLAHLGVDPVTAHRGMARARPDFGGFQVWRGLFGDPPRPAICASAFAANEPESSAALLALLRGRIAAENHPFVGILNLREDRGDRTLQWLEAIREGFFRGFAHVVLIGRPARAAYRRLVRRPAPDLPPVSHLLDPEPEALMGRVLSVASGEPVVIGLGNIAGPGERIVEHWRRQGDIYGP